MRVADTIVASGAKSIVARVLGTAAVTHGSAAPDVEPSESASASTACPWFPTDLAWVVCHD